MIHQIYKYYIHKHTKPRAPNLTLQLSKIQHRNTWIRPITTEMLNGDYYIGASIQTQPQNAPLNHTKGTKSIARYKKKTTHK